MEVWEGVGGIRPGPGSELSPGVDLNPLLFFSSLFFFHFICYHEESPPSVEEGEGVRQVEGVMGHSVGVVLGDTVFKLAVNDEIF